MVWVDRPKQFRRVADFVALFHFLFANIIMILGLFTPYFQSFGTRNPGLVVVCRYIDVPIASIKWIHTLLTNTSHHLYASLAVGELVIVLSSLLYAVITYFLLAALSWILFD